MWTNGGPKMSALTHSRQPPQFPPTMSLSTSHLAFGKKKLSSVSPEGSIPKKRREKGLRTAHTHWLPQSGWCFFPSSGASGLLSRGNLCVCEDPCQFLLVRKDAGTRKPILSMTSKGGPAKNRDLCHDHLQKGRMLLTFFSPKLWWPLPWPSETRPTGTGFFCRNWELYTRDPALRGWLPRLSAPNMCTHIPKMFPLNWNGCKCLSCRILSTQAAMGYTPARLLNQALCGSSQQESFRCRVWLNWQLGQRSQLLKCKCIQQGGERKPSRTNPPELYLHDRWVIP